MWCLYTVMFTLLMGISHGQMLGGFLESLVQSGDNTLAAPNQPTQPEVAVPGVVAKTSGVLTTAAVQPDTQNPIIEPKEPVPAAKATQEPKTVEEPKEPQEPKVIEQIAPKMLVEPKEPEAIQPKTIEPKTFMSAVAPKVVPKEVKAVEPKKVDDVVLQVQAEEPSDLDTINVESGGNWLEKRIWFKKAEQMFDEIRDSLKQAEDIRVEFIQNVHSVGQSMDEFYETVSYEKGQIDEMLKNILEDISQTSQERGGDLSENERSLKEQIIAEQKQITQIGDDIKKIADFDNQIDKTMMQAFKIIDICRDLETKSWNNYKEIGAELDDKKARSLYYDIDNAYKNIQRNITHLQDTLLPYLKTKLIAPAQNTMNSIKSSMKDLENKGIHLDQLIKGYDQQDITLEHQRDLEQEKDAEEIWEKEQAKKISHEPKSSKDTMYEKIAYFISSLIDTVEGFFVTIWDSIVEFVPLLKPAGEKIGLVAKYVLGIFYIIFAWLKQVFCTFYIWICNKF